MCLMELHEEWLRDQVGPGACLVREGHLEMPWGFPDVMLARPAQQRIVS